MAYLSDLGWKNSFTDEEGSGVEGVEYDERGLQGFCKACKCDGLTDEMVSLRKTRGLPRDDELGEEA
jgi:hypothetical protein